MPRIVIVGGHGEAALLFAPTLVARGDDAVALIRDSVQSADVTAVGVVPKVPSVEGVPTEDLASASTGTDAVVRTVGAGGKEGLGRTDAIDRAAAIRPMDAASRADVRRYVMVLWIGSHGNDPLSADHPLRDYALAKLVADRHLVGTDLERATVGPGTLTPEESSGEIDVRRQNGQGDSFYIPRGNVVAATVVMLTEFASIDKVIPFGDGSTSIAQAVESVSVEFSDLS